MRILMVVHQYPPEHVGGTELYTQQTGRALGQQGHTVAIFTRRDRAGQGMEMTWEDGLYVYRAWDGEMGPRRRYLAHFLAGSLTESFTRALTEFRPNVVHLQHLMGLPLDLLGQLQAAGIPYVITLHDYWWVCANAQLLTNYDGTVCQGPRAALNCTRCAVARSGPAAWPAAPALWVSLLERNRRLREGLAGAHTLLASTSFVADWYAAHGAPAHKMRVLPPGVDRPEPLPDRLSDRLPARLSNRLSDRAASRAEEPLRVAYVGGLAWQKGVHVAVEAAASLGDQVTLQVAGADASDPAYGEELRRLAGPHTRFLGQLDRTAVWRLLRESDVAVVPSLWYETYCYALHEAWAAGTPVVASDLGVMAAAVDDGVNGLLAAPGDVQAWAAALARLCESPTLTEELRRGITPPPTQAAIMAELDALYDDAAFGSASKAQQVGQAART